MAIPDSVLREWVASAERNPTMDAERYPNRADLARALLESRGALRAASSELEDAASFCCGRASHEDDLGWDDWMDMSDRYAGSAAAARRCLPESAT